MNIEHDAKIWAASGICAEYCDIDVARCAAKRADPTGYCRKPCLRVLTLAERIAFGR